MNVRDLSVLFGMAEKHLVRQQKMSGLGHLGAAVLFCGLPLLAAGCAGQPVQMGTFAKNLPAEQAMVLPPPAGPGIVSVIERRYDNAVDQDIFLYTSALTPGQNLLKAQFFGTVSPFKLSDNKLTSTPVTEAGIASEMRRALPGVRMVRSSFFVQNNYGPFGYAFGRGAGNDLCMYGWQQVRSPSGTISPLANHGSIQIRARICEANATEQKLLAFMYNYTITGTVDDGGWNPYGEPQPVSPSLGGVGAPIYPRPTSAEPIVPVLPQRTSAVHTRSGAAPVARSTPPAAAATSASVSSAAVPVVSVPRPVMTQTATSTSPVTAGPSVSRAPLVPSPSGLAQQTGRVSVPSPSCTDVTSGAANACR
ncbi:cellulose biosynthesis protein BcsN [Neorhizobium galegae]|nr:cellulose biosynthesis protein BcsN [Neorhizobium galegae]KAB1113692.1 cellulose biosynthesis protein BcsN [Neorhizobium galegae]